MRRLKNFLRLWILRITNFVSIGKWYKWQRALKRHKLELAEWGERFPNRQPPLIWDKGINDYRWLTRNERRAKMQMLKSKWAKLGDVAK